MSLDKLAVIFIIIILPISVVLSSYTSAQGETLRLQNEYDTKLYNATYDAVKAYQLNSFNEDSSDLANSRQRLIKASANAFFNSLADNFSMSGYTKEEVQDYVPALVFTLYDGYYIYSKYTNKLDFTYDPTKTTNPTYTDGQELYGVKPLIHYSCRYQRNGGADDFVITYTLDNYITIQGIIDGKAVCDSGYLINPDKITDDNSTAHTIKYDGYEIKPEELQEYVGVEKYKYHKVDGKKYYLDPDFNGTGSPKWFYLLNGVKNYPEDKFDTGDNTDYSAYYYYHDAREFTQRVLNTYKLGNIKTSNIVNDDVAITEVDNLSDASDNKYTDVGDIFAKNDIEKPGSNFNQHRLEVIKKSIQSNLSIAIANYNKYTAGTSLASYDFQMPVLKESEWEKILSNTSVISFMQGLPIGFKIYDGCTVIPNNKNYEVVSEESIYIANGKLNDMDKDNLKYYYKATSSDLKGKTNLVGIMNVDMERRYFYDEDDPNKVIGDYYYPKFYLADYNSIVGSTKVNNLENYNKGIYEYFKSDADLTNAATAYFTALGRERYSMYHANANEDVIKAKYLVP